MRHLLLLAMLAGCHAASAPPASPVPNAAPVVAVTPSGQAGAPHEPAARAAMSAPAEAADELLAITATWDDHPGADDVRLLADGTLIAGHSSGKAELTEPSRYFFDKQASLRVVELGHARHARAILLSLPIAEEEDPPNRYQLFVASGQRLERVLDVTLGAYGVTELEFVGQGTAEYVEDGWTACGRTHYPTVAARQRVTYALRDGTMQEIARVPSGEVQRCDELAACPFVYVIDGEREERIGEILRNLRGRAAYARQSLAVPATLSSPQRPVTIRLSEEKPEITYLDAIWLEVDGRKLLPDDCHDNSGHPGEPPAYCASDRRYTRLGEGDELELTFASGGETVELVARGFYIPTPTLATR